MGERKINEFLENFTEEQMFEYERIFRFKAQEISWIESLITLSSDNKKTKACCETMFWIKLAEVLRSDFSKEPSNTLKKASFVWPEARVKVFYLNECNEVKSKLRKAFTREDLLFIDLKRQESCHINQSGYRHRFKNGVSIRSTYSSNLVDKIDVKEADSILKEQHEKFFCKEKLNYHKAVREYSEKSLPVLKELLKVMKDDFKDF